MSDKPLEVSEENFQSTISGTEPVLVDFWAEWCGPCRMIAPALEEIATELAGRLTVAKLNVDENQAVAMRFGVRGIPTLILFSEGREIDRIVGALPKAALKARLEAALPTPAA